MVHPGNDWIAQRLAQSGIATTVPRFHGFLRGALAGPAAVTLAQALEVLEKSSPAPSAGGPGEERGFLAGVADLWDAIAHAYRKGGTFPPAIGHHPDTDKGNQVLVEEIVDLVEAFLEGFEAAGGGSGEEGLTREVEDLLDDLDLLLRAMDELDAEIGKQGIVALQTRLLYEGLARLEKGMRAVARASRQGGLPSADPSAARKGARKKRRGEP